MGQFGQFQSLSPRDNLAVSDRSLGTADVDRCRLKAGVNTAYINYNDKRPANADTYPPSKHTDINAVTVYFNNLGLAQAAPGQAGFLGGVTASASTDSNGFSLGIRHRF